MRVSKVIPAEQAPTVLCDSVIVRVDEKKDDDAIIENLFSITARHRGPCPLYVEVQTSDQEIATIKCNDEMSVEATPQCLHELATLIGEANVVCTGPKRRPIPWSRIMPAPLGSTAN